MRSGLLYSCPLTPLVEQNFPCCPVRNLWYIDIRFFQWQFSENSHTCILVNDGDHFGKFYVGPNAMRMGAQIVDYEKIAATAVETMTAADLHRFLVVCALVSDLYCPGYNPRQSLEKNSNLAQAASRYKVDTAKVATSVRAELSKAENKANDIRQPTKKSNTAKSPHP